MSSEQDDAPRKVRPADDDDDIVGGAGGDEPSGAAAPDGEAEGCADETDGADEAPHEVEACDGDEAMGCEAHGREIAELREDLSRERQRAGEAREQLIRTAADFDNFRKRTERDRVDERRQAASGLVRDLLPVLDALGRALESAGAAEANAELAGFVAGVRMIETQFKDALRQAGLERVDTAGTFDPLYHEALMQEPCDDKPHLSILQVFEEGYRLGGRLLRPARVKVAHNPDGAREHDAEESAQGAASPDTDG